MPHRYQAFRPPAVVLSGLSISLNKLVYRYGRTVETVAKFDHKPRADDLLTVRYYINNAVTNH